VSQNQDNFNNNCSGIVINTALFALYTIFYKYRIIVKSEEFVKVSYFKFFNNSFHAGCYLIAIYFVNIRKEQ